MTEGGTHAQRIIALLVHSPGLDDDEIARALNITPRQTVNQICHRLAKSNVLTREPGARGKIVNRLFDGVPAPDVRHVARADVRPAAEPVPRGSSPALSLVPLDLA